MASTRSRSKSVKKGKEVLRQTRTRSLSSKTGLAKTSCEEQTEFLQRMKSHCELARRRKKSCSDSDSDTEINVKTPRKHMKNNVKKKPSPDAQNSKKPSRKSSSKKTLSPARKKVKPAIVISATVPTSSENNCSAAANDLMTRAESTIFVGTEQLSDSGSEREMTLLDKKPTASEETKKELDSMSSSSESDWEEVKDGHDDDREPVIPKDGVEITLDLPDFIKKRNQKKEFDTYGYLRWQINRFKKYVQLNIHKVHLLGLTAHGMYVNSLVNEDIVRACAMSVASLKFIGVKGKSANLNHLKRVVEWYCDTIKFDSNEDNQDVKLVDTLVKSFDSKSAPSEKIYVLMLLSILRLLNFDVRLVMSYRSVPVKPHNLIRKRADRKSIKPLKATDGVMETEAKEKTVDQTSLTEVSITKVTTTKDKKVSHKLVADEDTPKKRLRSRMKKPVVDIENSDEDCDEVPKRKRQTNTLKKVKKAKRQSNLNGDVDSDFEVDENDAEVKEESYFRKKTHKRKNRFVSCEEKKEDEAIIGTDIWLEVYVVATASWVCVDVIHGEVDCIAEMEERISKPVTYIMTFDNRNNVKDVTQRYVEYSRERARKLRVDNDWWDKTLAPLQERKTKRAKKENEEMETQEQERPMPKRLIEFKHHPLYALERHILKFEAFYPPNPPPLGYIRGEAIYARECVFELKARDKWFREAKVVRIGEEPYKNVTCLRWNRILKKIDKNVPLELFGPWQVEDYDPPQAVDGKIPRNEYGNVELFKPCMLPKGTVQLRIPGINRVAKKLNIDCAPVMIGWDQWRPMFDGYAVCKEYSEQLVDAWYEQLEVLKKRSIQKKEKRIWGNWRRLIRRLLIRERLNDRYGISEDPSDEKLDESGDEK